MCGIAGEWAARGREVDAGAAPRMIRSLTHRGPDGWGCYLEARRRAMLLHTRLAIMDPGGGSQPLLNEDGSVVLVANGEFYGFEEQRRQLEGRGHRFRSRSDSEVAVHLYEEHGEDFVHHLRGEFALALLDVSRGALYLVRDRFGIKPLYYHQSPEGILFGSEIKALFAHGRPARELDLESVQSMLHGLEVPGSSFFRGINAVEPGCLLRLDDAGCTRRRYWDLPWATLEEEEAARRRPQNDMVEEFGARLDEAVTLRLRADVDVGVYLSGGIDSTAVASLAARRRGTGVHAFTVSFTDPGYDEGEEAQATAAALGMKMHSTRVGPGDLASCFLESLWHCERPVFNSHGAAKFQLSALARQEVKVVLTGEGADELLAGYPEYRHQLLLERLLQDPGDGKAQLDMRQLLRRQRLLSGLSRGRTYQEHARVVERFGAYPYQVLRALRGQPHVARALSPAARQQLAGRDAITALAASLHDASLAGRSGITATQHLAFKVQLPGYILNALGDRTEMAHSIEGRLPFLDHKLVEFCCRLPQEMRVRLDAGKQILRRAMEGVVPGDAAWRPKKIFQAPTLSSLRQAAPGDLARHYLSAEVTRRAGAFNPRFLFTVRLLARLLPAHGPARARCEAGLTMILSLNALHDLFVENFDATRRRHERSDLAGPELDALPDGAHGTPGQPFLRTEIRRPPMR